VEQKFQEDELKNAKVYIDHLEKKVKMILDENKVK